MTDRERFAAVVRIEPCNLGDRLWNTVNFSSPGGREP
jgi:hypothetical protein